MANAERDSPNIAILLGAGASVEAGCPTVEQLTESFAEFLGLRGKTTVGRTYRWVVDRLGSLPMVLSGHTKVDIELVLSTIRELQHRDEHVLSAFVHRSGWTKELQAHARNLPELELLLQSHIRAECEVRRAQIEYLRPLLSFVATGAPLNVFTLNYDYTVELLCQEAAVAYTDGFATYWQPELLDQASSGIVLHKLHGSLLWYQTVRPPQKLVKIPIANHSNPVAEPPRFFSDDAVSTSVLYPALTKEQHVEPYATLLARFRDVLQRADVLVVIGYSFRDHYIKDLVIQKLHENPSLRIVLVSPDASDVVMNSDSMLAGTWQFSHVSHRIQTVSMAAGAALAFGYLPRLIRVGQDARRLAQRALELRLMGTGDEREVAAAAALKLLVDAEDLGEFVRLVSAEQDNLWHRALRASAEDDARYTAFQLASLTAGSPEDAAAVQRHVCDLELKAAYQAAFASGDRTLTYIGDNPRSPVFKDQQEANDWFLVRAQSATSTAESVARIWKQARLHLPPEVVKLGNEFVLDMRVIADYWNAGARGFQGRSFGFGSEDRVSLPIPEDAAVKTALGARIKRQGPLWLQEIPQVAGLRRASL